jgi:hypothetical protein
MLARETPATEPVKALDPLAQQVGFPRGKEGRQCVRKPRPTPSGS